MKSPIVKRSVVLAGHNTSVSLEDAFWQGLKDIAMSRRTTLSDLISSIDILAASAVISRRLYGCLCLVTTKPAQRDLGSERWPVSKRINSSITRR